MWNIVAFIVILVSLFNLSNKGSHMEKNRRIDKIDTKKDHKELIALYYKIELRAFVQAVLYKHYQKYVIKE
jgi:hypothetical protein